MKRRTALPYAPRWAFGVAFICTLAWPSLARAGCDKDTDCKGERVCVEAQCVEPTAVGPAVGADATPSPPPSESVATGTVKITSDLPGDVRIDGGVIGRTPLEQSGLPPGNHELRVDFDAGGNRKQRIMILGGQTVEVHVVPSEARDTASHREGLKLGISAGAHVMAATQVGIGILGDPGFIMNVGLIPAVDLRFGIHPTMGAVFNKHGGQFALAPRVPFHVRFNLGSVYSMVVGLQVGAMAQPEAEHATWMVGPELSALSFRFGEQRQLEVMLMQHLWVTSGEVVRKDAGGSGPSWVLNNSLQLAYLFL